jgi:hypothetical protein
MTEGTIVVYRSTDLLEYLGGLELTPASKHVRIHLKVYWVDKDVRAIQYQDTQGRYYSVSEFDVLTENELKHYIAKWLEAQMQRSPKTVDFYAHMTRRADNRKRLSICVTPSEARILCLMRNAEMVRLVAPLGVERKLLSNDKGDQHG